jgi:pilus assembly protein CpaF
MAFRGPGQRSAHDVLAGAIPQMDLEMPLTAVSARSVSARLLGQPVSTDPEGNLSESERTYRRLRQRVQQRLVADSHLQESDDDVTLRERIAELVNETATEFGLSLDLEQGAAWITRVRSDLLGFGPLDKLLSEPGITEIMVNGPDQVFLERGGRLALSQVTFEDIHQVEQVIDRMVARVGRRIDESSPMVDARLEDGSRIHAVIPPASLSGPTLTIRRFAASGLEPEDLVQNGTLSTQMLNFLRVCVRARLNILIAGGTGSGKTTTLNALSSFIPDDERIITIEDAAELQLRQRHVISMETRPPNVEGRGQITVRDLVISSLRMRPDRLVVGECRGGEALDMLQAMSTGHDGSLTTLHASSTHEAITRLETMVLMAGTDLPVRAIRNQIASSIDLVVQQARLRDGGRRVVSVSEVVGVEDGEVILQELFRFDQTGLDEAGRVLGAHRACDRVPRRTTDILATGEILDLEGFLDRTASDAPRGPRRRLSDWMPGVPAGLPPASGERRAVRPPLPPPPAVTGERRGQAR